MSRAARPRRSPIREAESSIRGEMARGVGPRPTSVSSGRLPFVAKPPTVPQATRHPEPPPVREHERERERAREPDRETEPAPRPPAHEPSRTLPRKRGAVAEDATGNPRSKLVELRSKIAILQEQNEDLRAQLADAGGGAGTPASPVSVDDASIEDALAFIDSALASIRGMPSDKQRDSAIRMLERAKESLT